MRADVTPAAIHADVMHALQEDIGDGDLTAMLIPEQAHGAAQVVCREAAVLCGQAWFTQVFNALSTDIVVEFSYQDGDLIPAHATICELHGPARALLSGERCALNFLQTLSGTATVARQFVQQLQSGTKMLDTRKTIPGLRVAQKYAVRCGGAENHRFGLYDAILIKENHIQACGSIAQAVSQAKAQHAGIKIEVEVENFHEFEEAVQAGVDSILLDNFDTLQIKAAVKRNCGVKLEVSGGVTLASVGELSALGVDYISSGALTKDVRAIDFSMRFID